MRIKYGEGILFDSNYVCGILAKRINMGLKLIILRFIIIDLGAKFG